MTKKPMGQSAEAALDGRIGSYGYLAFRVVGASRRSGRGGRCRERGGRGLGGVGIPCNQATRDAVAGTIGAWLQFVTLSIAQQSSGRGRRAGWARGWCVPSHGEPCTGGSPGVICRARLA